MMGLEPRTILETRELTGTEDLQENKTLQDGIHSMITELLYDRLC